MDFSSVDTTSPPGKLTVDAKRKLLLQGQLALLNYTIHHSFTYERWYKVATIMIQKDPQSSKIHRLRVIHLYLTPLRSEVAIFDTPLHRQPLIEPGSIWRTPRKRRYDSPYF
jgi:hypothetical protein